MFRRVASLAILFLCVAGCSADRGDEPAGIVIGDAWTRPTVDGMSMGVAYFTVTNRTGEDDILIAATTPAAARVEIHESMLEDGMARMRPLAEIRVPAHGRVVAAPGGIHLMLVDLAQPLVAGTQVPLTLRFRKAGPVTIRLAVGRGGSAPL
jgi:periplasmic copper chaperone A